MTDTLPLMRSGAASRLPRSGRHGRPRPARDGAGRVCRRGCSPRGCGNRWTYAGDGVAPGQMPAARLLGEFGFRRIRADATLYGVVGNPIAHSLSPVMHNAGFSALGLNAVYVPLASHATSMTSSPSHARRGMAGASITAPFKVGMLTQRRRDRRDGASASARSTRSSCATAAGLARTRTSMDSSRRSPAGWR